MGDLYRFSLGAACWCGLWCGIAAGFAPPANQEPSQCSELELEAELLASVEHRTMRVRDQERDAYFEILKRARDSSYRKQQACAAKHLAARRKELPQYRDRPIQEFPVFVDLFSNPERYHGKLVTLRGHVRKLDSYPAGTNSVELTTLFEAWLFTEDSQSNPAVIVCTEVPEGMPRGEDMVEAATVTGYFFKLYGYDARDTKRVAPLLLAQRIEWQPAVKTGWSRTASRFLYAGVAAVLVGMLLVFRWVGGRDRRFRQKRLERARQVPDSDSSVDFSVENNDGDEVF